jgi:uncharacterized protein HemX
VKAPAPESTQKPPETLQAPAARAVRTTSARGLTFVLMLLLAGFALSAWQMWLLQDEQKAQAQRLTALMTVQAELDQTQRVLSDLTQGQSQIAEALQDVTRRVESQAETLAAVRQQTTEQAAVWQLAEVATLVRMASLALNVFADVQQATGFLRRADEALIGVEGRELIALRAAIASDLTQLARVPSVDRIGLYLTLGQLMNTVPDLPLRRVMLAPKQVPPPTPPPAAGFWGWAQQAWDTLWVRLVGLVDFRRGEAIPKPIPTMQAAQDLRQNLLLSLSTAQGALLRLEQPIFDEELRKVDAWVVDYFDPTAPSHQAFLVGLGQLKMEIIQPELPSIEGSIAALVVAQAPQVVSP